MDEQIQSILDTANAPQPTAEAQPTSNADPLNAILESAGVTPTDSPTPTPGDAQDVTNAQERVGDTADNGYCERFAEEVAGTPFAKTASEAWNNFASEGKAHADISHAPEGSLIYFKPDASNGYAGHVAVTDGRGNIIGATYNGVQKSTLNDWMTQTGQQPAGYVIP